MTINYETATLVSTFHCGKSNPASIFGQEFCLSRATSRVLPPVSIHAWKTFFSSTEGFHRQILFNRNSQRGLSRSRMSLARTISRTVNNVRLHIERWCSLKSSPLRQKYLQSRRADSSGSINQPPVSSCFGALRFPSKKNILYFPFDPSCS